MAYFCKLVKKILSIFFRNRVISALGNPGLIPEPLISGTHLFTRFNKYPAARTVDTDQFKGKNKHFRQPLPDRMKRLVASEGKITKKDQSTIYCGRHILLTHFVVFSLYKGNLFC